MAALVLLVPLAIVGKALLGHRTPATPTPTAALASPSVSPTPTRITTAPTTAPTTTGPKSTTPTPVATIADCNVRDLSVSVTTDAQTYAVGSPVTIAMRISNTGSSPCKRDVGALPNEVWVTDVDGLVVWTSDACQTAANPQVVTMRPGSTFGNTQVWSGLNSGRDCTSAAADATAGNYFAHARNDTVESKPYAFTIN